MFETLALWLILIWAVFGGWLAAAAVWESLASRRTGPANKPRSAP